MVLSNHEALPRHMCSRKEPPALSALPYLPYHYRSTSITKVVSIASSHDNNVKKRYIYLSDE